MPLFTTADADAILDQVRQQHEELGRALGIAPAERSSVPDETIPLYRDLLLLIEVANGAYHRTDAELRRVELALARVHALLLATPSQAPIVLSEAFWQTKL